MFIVFKADLLSPLAPQIVSHASISSFKLFLWGKDHKLSILKYSFCGLCKSSYREKRRVHPSARSWISAHPSSLKISFTVFYYTWIQASPPNPFSINTYTAFRNFLCYMGAGGDLVLTSFRKKTSKGYLRGKTDSTNLERKKNIHIWKDVI